MVLRSKKKGQAAVEYIFIVSIALLLLIPGTVIFYRYSADSQSSLAHAQVYKIGNDIINTGELMFSMGVAWQTVEVSLPGSVESIVVYNASPYSEMVISYDADEKSEAVFFTRRQLFNSTASDCAGGCKIPVVPGVNKLRVESRQNGDVVIRVR